MDVEGKSIRHPLLGAATFSFPVIHSGIPIVCTHDRQFPDGGIHASGFYWERTSIARSWLGFKFVERKRESSFQFSARCGCPWPLNTKWSYDRWIPSLISEYFLSTPTAATASASNANVALRGKTRDENVGQRRLSQIVYHQSRLPTRWEIDGTRPLSINVLVSRQLGIQNS